MSVALTIVGLLALSACGSTAGSTAPAGTPTPTLVVGGTVILGASSFVQTSVTISAGQSLRLVDPADTGGTHQLCLGTGGRCDPNAQGPSELQGTGLALHPGDTKDIGFPHAGQYDVTCTIHPAMQLSISVLGTG